ncbi:restriction endonuclease subunit S [Ligilactobacillus aviarius]|uniref:restriction endonuclease subunit S n=1 Tax=Ligilactobacillus aviarius TaxID=1606 RepID=UPI00249DA272|nr:restriction endonuclease subunit S [Ligilactobacillus aviarius]
MTKADKEGQRKAPILRFKGFTDDWEQRKLGEIGKVRSCKRIYRNQTSNIGEIPFYKIGTFGKEADSFISRELYEEYKEKFSFPQVGDVLISASGTLGRIVTYSGENAYFQDSNIVWLDNDNHLALNKYLEIYYQRIHWKASEGSTIKRLYNSDIEKTIISIPKRDEQSKISEYLKLLNKVIALYERKFKLLSRVKKYFLDNLFAEKEYPNLRFKGFTNTWEKIKLKDTQTTLTDGNYANLYPKPTDMTDADKGIPFLTGGNLKDGILDLKNAKYITKEKHSQLRSGHLEEDDIVIAVRGSLGELGYVTKQNIDWNINSQLAIIRTSKNELIGNFLLYFFLSSKGKSKLLSRQTGTALKQLPLQQLKTIVIPKTLLLEQQKISNILKTIDKTISFYKDKQQHLAEIKNTLLNTMFI